MEGSGANVNIIHVISPQGEETRTTIIVSHDTVELGGWTFKRDDLLFAIGIKDEKSHR